jgi:Mlc titration factor MtfA (ptsG expression regulator)
VIRFLRERRRRRLRALAADPAWTRVLEHRFVAFRHLSAADRDELLGHVRVLLDEKRFEGCGGFELNDEARVLVAAVASLLLLHRHTGYFPGLMSILIYPDAYVVPVQFETGGGLVVEEEIDHIGESWDTGSLILSWRDVLLGAAGRGRGCNVALETRIRARIRQAGRDGRPPPPNLH